MLLAALLGFGAGFVGSVPIAGPISALVVSRALQARFRAGVYIALGGAIVEGLYAFLAFWGFSRFLTQYPIIDPISRGVGAVVLLVLGITFVRKKAEKVSAPKSLRDSRRGSFFLGVWICALNPTLIASWSAVVTMLYSSDAIDFEAGHALPFAFGCAGGISAWFATLVALVRRYREKFSATALARFVNVLGVLLLVLAAWFAVRFVQYFTEGATADDPLIEDPVGGDPVSKVSVGGGRITGEPPAASALGSR